MSNAKQNQNWIRGTRGRTATAALASAILFVLAGFAAGSAQAQTFTTLANLAGSTDGANPLYGYPIAISGANGYGVTSGGGTYDQGTVIQGTASGNLTTLYNFCSQVNCTDGAEPFSGLVISGGNGYGTTYWGGLFGQGTIFEITPAGQLTTLHSFAGGPTEGAFPIAGLVQVRGNFYGTTQLGGASGLGTIFEMTPGGQLTNLYSFCSQPGCADGELPYAGLIQGANGNLYGTTLAGGTSGTGTVFEITPAGQLTTLYKFCSQPGCTDGAAPFAGLVQANGNFYGTTEAGGTSGYGTVYEITPAGRLTTLYNFCSLSGCADGFRPYAGLLLASDGNLYGTTTGETGLNGVFSFGTVFGMTLAGQLTTLHTFVKSDGAFPFGGLVEGSSNGILYGATNYGGSEYNGTIFSLPLGLNPTKEKQHISRMADASFGFRGIDLQTAKGAAVNQVGPALARVPSARPRVSAPLQPTTASIKPASRAGVHTSGAEPLANLLNFDGANGAFPYFTSFVQGTDGNLYGTTENGGPPDEGTVFRVTTGGTLTRLYTFCSQTNCTDGVEPLAGLVQGNTGNFYGTTSDGGANGGGGTVFEITPAGQLTTLYSFCSQPGCVDGNYSQAPLVQASNGNFYGTTTAGGASNVGTVFEITAAAQFTTLYSFCSQPNCTDGSHPYAAGLVQASNGNLYGTTSEGGASVAGTVFEITPAGQLTTLYSFCSQPGCTDGALPYSGVIQGTDGNLYGTTFGGGTSGEGTVFEITPAGQLTTLYMFCPQPGCTDGAGPVGGLVQANGNFYGTTEGGGPSAFGTVFEITPAGQLTTLYSFDLTDGAYPEGGLVQASDGNLHGMTNFGGNRLGGIVFSLPPVITLSGPTGTAQVGVPYSSALTASGGVAPYTFSITSGALPPGLTLNTSSGAITGTPSMAGTYTFTAHVVDSKGNTATGSFSIMVTSAGTSPTTTSLTLAPTSVTVGSAGPIVMTATVMPVSGSGTPTGVVTYFNGSTQVGVAKLSGGVGIFNYNPSSLAVGIYSITAVYTGDDMFSASTSPSQTLAITQNGPFAYVTNINSNTVSVINTPTSTVANTITVGSGPWGVAVSPGQTQVYVSNNHGNNVSVIDTASGTVAATIPVQLSPFGVAFTPDGTEAYVVNGSSNSVSIINTDSQTVSATVPVQQSPVGVAMALTSNGTFAYVTNSASNSVSVIAVSSSTVVKTIPVGFGPRWVAVAPNSSLAYVENAGSNTVSVISVATNTVTATIPVGMSPFGAAFTPDSSLAYIVNSASNTVSIVDTATSSVIATVAGFSNPVHVALSSDSSSAYVTNLGANNVSVITTASNTVTGTVGVGSGPIDVAIAAAAPTSEQITQPLSPTKPNVFNFGTNTYQVQYPAGTNFSNIDMTVNSVQLTQAQFQLRVAGTQFANATCVVYSGAGGNCVDDEVTCSQNGSPITCPSEAQPTIAVQTSFTTLQGIINPGYLTTPIGQNNWTNIFSGFSDPTVRGKTTGFSEFVAVSLGATNPQGAAKFQIIHPIFPKTYAHGQTIPIAIRLTSIATGKPITDAEVSIVVVMTADAHGNPTQKTVFSKTDAFVLDFSTHDYLFNLQAGNYAAGTYTVTIYGNAFPAFQGQFKILN